MGIGSVFKKVGNAILDIGKAVANIADVPFAVELVAIVPVVGPAIAIAMKWVDKAEEVWSDVGKSGTEKRHWAISKIQKELYEASFDVGRARALLELAVLLNKNEAFLRDVVGKIKDATTGETLPVHADEREGQDAL